jgi:hypothetical protein
MHQSKIFRRVPTWELRELEHLHGEKNASRKVAIARKKEKKHLNRVYRRQLKRDLACQINLSFYRDPNYYLDVLGWLAL